METIPAHQKKIFRQYVIELSSALALYAVVLTVAISVGEHMRSGIWRTLLLVSPMGPFMLMLLAIVRQFRRVDEYARMQILENIAISAAVTAGWTFTYGFLENAGFPRLTMFTVGPVMGILWGGVAILRGQMCR